MDEPVLNSPPQSTQGLGYAIADSESASHDALQRLLAYVRDLRRKGAETRNWAARTVDQFEGKLGALDGSRGWPNGSSVLADLSGWESHILSVVRHYMQEVSTTLSRIRMLNPPLTTEQLRPFLHAVEDDRGKTVQALEPVNAAFQKLTAWKEARPEPHRVRSAA